MIVWIVPLERPTDFYLLARLNTDRLEAQVVQAKASLESSKARVEEAKATVLETRVKMKRCCLYVSCQNFFGSIVKAINSALAWE